MESGSVANDSGPLNSTPDVHLYGKTAAMKQRRSNTMLFVFRLLTFSFSLAAVLVMGTNKQKIRSAPQYLEVAWHDFDPFRYVFAVNAIICVYSFVETWLAVYTLSRGTLLLPETFQVWFDYGHDQGFACLLFSANSVGIAMAQLLQSGSTLIQGQYYCSDAGAYCTQARVSIAMGFGAFLFLALSSFLTGLRVARWYLP
ncbi:CASP-like protein 4C1 [Physcomitrium patens]|uniref:CASP-like protein 4C1 n=2 Tax=Physcomitrium patens TaxID=3218 RepID=CSPL9_PHYPA|nr:CASP-like protein 4C1 [Physcomitrium patens]XP_024390299.1 CASP-like protein 4C1 [Physcomitrium patens]A9STU1.1 RecName: Full=CASP-like protein 4C1; Short=PpCASPL4C1 [Physcomitrium patens]PNR44291.1 hypothetical protein PHYPA_016675 [Physcomitrium patens]|eukprot:XP_024390298.1 CASP-like protein 4C1 [Physcomitrella patens]